MSKAASGLARGQWLQGAGGAGMSAGEARKQLEAAGTEKAAMALLATPLPQVGYLCTGKIFVHIFLHATLKDGIAFFYVCKLNLSM